MPLGADSGAEERKQGFEAAVGASNGIESRPHQRGVIEKVFGGTMVFFFLVHSFSVVNLKLDFV